MPKNFSDFLPLALIAWIVLRRAGRSKKVRVERMWVTPVLSIAAVWLTLAEEPTPRLAAIALMAAAAIAGIASGYLSALHLELTMEEKGKIFSKATPLGTYLIAGFFLLRFTINNAINGGWSPGPPSWVNPKHAVDALRMADAALLFSTGMVVAQRGEVWRRAQALIKGQERPTTETGAAT
jgi:hypothetical protein